MAHTLCLGFERDRCHERRFLVLQIPYNNRYLDDALGNVFITGSFLEILRVSNSFPSRSFRQAVFLGSGVNESFVMK